MKQGGYADLPGCKVSDLMKSSTLDVSTVLQTALQDNQFAWKLKLREILC
jgi:hypothetical protein